QVDAGGDSEALALIARRAAGTTTTTAKASTSATTLVPLAAGKIDTTITLFMPYVPSYVAQWGTEAVARTRLSNIVQLATSAYSN
ncbi:hypothetical protein, partial [Acinetobacter baumannii]|uniref:hypothetical protein n=1 Tax=Acinetobacter baumannii TaxID=470 RepID=UPI00148768EF